MIQARMLDRACRVCGSAQKRVLYPARLPAQGDVGAVVHSRYLDSDGTGTHWRFRVVRCLACGHVYSDPVFDLGSMSESYREQTHDNRFGVDADVLLRTNRGYAQFVEQYLPADRCLQVDIGCDVGLFLKSCRDWGFRRVVGVEPGASSAQQAAEIPGVEVMCKLFDASDFGEDTINFVSMIHVLDHIEDPVAFLSRLRVRMARGGRLLIVVHDISSPIAKLSGSRWPPIGVIHYDYFSGSSLCRAVEAAGYRCLAITRTVNYFPLHHLVRLAPGIPKGIRRWAHSVVSWPILRRVVLGLPLGNIALVAQV